MELRSGRHRVVALSVGVVALLALTPGPAGADENLGSPGSLTYIRESAQVPIGEIANLVADCPDGLRLTGGGVDAVRMGTEGLLSTTNPYAGGKTAWQGYVQNTDPVFPSNTADAYAICAAGSPSVRSVSRTMAIDDARTAKVSCPAGTRVTGGGVYESGSVQELWVNSTRPFDNADQDARPDDGWRGKAYNSSNVQQTLTVYAVCRDVPMTYRSNLFNESGTNDGLVGGRPCPSDRHLSGAGGSINGNPAVRRLSGVVPHDLSQDPGAAPDDSVLVKWVYGSAGNQNVAVGTDVLCTP